MIVIAGATGFTGSLISRELYKMGHPPVLAGRDQRKLANLARDISSSGDGVPASSGELEGHSELSTVIFDATDPDSISHALSDASVIINCAGAFMDLGEPVLKEAASRGIHYIDTTGEQPFIRTAIEEYGPKAAKSKSSVIPACAFEYALGDAAAAFAAISIEPCEGIELFYSIDGFGSSRGTKKSVLRVLGETGYQRHSGKAVKTGIGAHSRAVDIPGKGTVTAYSMPGGEVFMVPLHIAVDDLETYMVMPAPAAVVRLTPLMAPVLSWGPVARFLSNRVDSGQFGPSAEERANTRFVIVCKATGAGGSRTVTVQGGDPYGLTALIAARIAALIDSGQAQPVGATAPSMVAGFQTIIDLTSEAAVDWSVSEAKQK